LENNSSKVFKSKKTGVAKWEEIFSTQKKPVSGKIFLLF